jgi:hypothetical protein
MKSSLPSILAPLCELQNYFPPAAGVNFSPVTIPCHANNSRQLAME